MYFFVELVKNDIFKTKYIQMKNTSTFLLLFLFLSSTQFSYAQSKSSIEKLRSFQNISFESNSTEVSHFFQVFQKEMGINDKTSFDLKSVHEGTKNVKHHRFNQTYQNIPVYNSMYIVHTANNSVTHANGYFLPDINIDVQSNFDEKNILNYAIQVFENQYATKINAESIEIEKCIIDNIYPQFSGDYKLAYRVKLSSIEDESAHEYVINATTKAIIYDESQIIHVSIPSQGLSRYYGVVDFLVDSLSPSKYLLFDDTRGDGIVTCLNSSVDTAFSDDNTWNSYEEDKYYTAVDAHHCTSRFYDMMIEDYSWDGLDNEGKALKVVVYDGDSGNGDYVNAFWNGSFATFGKGDCHYGPLTTYEVVAHEFMHGITDYTSDLIYNGESGAINESMSDVFGKALEYKEDQENFLWTIGSSFLQDDYTEPFRSMEDPKSFGLPQTYKGQNWNDNGGVHTNSAVGNHFFYRLVEGGSGTTEADEDFDITGIGMEKATELIFEVQSSYLFPNAGYQDYYDYSKIVAADIYGTGSPEYETVLESWKVVGLPFQQDTTPKFDLSVSGTPNLYYSCEVNGTDTIFVDLKNTGSLDVPQGEIIYFTFSGESLIDTFDYILPDTLFVGESDFLTFPDIIQLDETKTHLVTVEIKNEDKVIGNNKVNVFYINKTIPDGNLEMRSVKLDFKPCEGNTIDTEFTIRNQSCNSITLDDLIITVIDVNSEEVIQSFEVNENTIPSGSQRRFNFLIDYSGHEEVYAVLESAQDVTPGNNISGYFNPPTNKVMFTEYFNDFEQLDDLSNFNKQSIVPLDVKEVEENNYLWNTGRYASNGNDLCSNIEDNFIPANYNTPVVYETCIFTQLTDGNWEMSFDLAQFRNDEIDIDQSIAPNSAIMRWSMIEKSTNEILASSIISNQEEGMLINHLYSLPFADTSVLRLEFYNHTGFGASNTLDLEYDNQLLDNFSYFFRVSSEETEYSPTISLYPNPSLGTFTVASSEKITSIDIISTTGIQYNLGTNKISEYSYSIDIPSPMPGVYFAKIVLESGEEIMERIVLVK